MGEEAEGNSLPYLSRANGDFQYYSRLNRRRETPNVQNSFSRKIVYLYFSDPNYENRFVVKYDGIRFILMRTKIHTYLQKSNAIVSCETNTRERCVNSI